MQKEDNMAEVSEKALAFVEKNKAQRRQRKNILRPFKAEKWLKTECKKTILYKNKAINKIIIQK